MLPQYNTKLFSEIYPDVNGFVSSYVPSGITVKPITDDNAKILYYLLYARFGNNPIINNSETQFKFKVWAVIFQYGPTWEKRLSVQASLRALSDAELRTGSKRIYNHAYNPSTDPSTDTLDGLTTINEQTADKNQRSVLDAYSFLLDLLKTDVTEEFINKFKPLFKTFVTPERTKIYVTDEQED